MAMSYTSVAVLGIGGALAGRARLGPQWGDSSGPVSRTAGLPDPASLSRSQAVMVQDQRLPRVPAEPGTIPRLCARLLGAGETKRKCQKRVNQTRYSVTITSLSGLLGPCAPRAQAGHLRGAHSRYWGPVLWVCQQPKLASGPRAKANCRGASSTGRVLWVLLYWF